MCRSFSRHRPTPEKNPTQTNSKRALSAAVKPEYGQSIGSSGGVLGFCLRTMSSFPSKVLDALFELCL